GVSWQAIHYVLGLPQLGWGVFYVEGSGAPPHDPPLGVETEDCPHAASASPLGMATEDCSHAVAYVADVMRRIGLPDRWAYVDLMHGETHGLPRARLQAPYRDAPAIGNLCGATAPREEHRRGPKLLYIETDPVYEQVRIALGEVSSLGFLASHDVLFT